MRRILSILMVSALMAAIMVASAMPAFAAPKQGKGCKGLLNATAKQTTQRPGGANEVLLQKAAARGCTPPAVVPTPVA